MKALLIVIFAAYVTTVLSEKGIEVLISDDSQEDELESFLFHNDDDAVDEKQLEKCFGKSKGAFSFYDYSVVIAMLAVSLKIGLFYGYFHKSARTSHLVDAVPSKMGLFPVTLSLATSFITAIELLGNPAEMFFYGTQFSLIGKNTSLELLSKERRISMS